MKSRVSNFLSHAANIFSRKSQGDNRGGGYGNNFEAFGGSSVRTYGGEKTIIQALYTRMAVDASTYKIKHVIVDTSNDSILRYVEASNIDRLFNRQANIDQTGRMFIQNVVNDLIINGSVAIVPVDLDYDLENQSPISTLIINEIRTGKITAWYPTSVDVETYNGITGMRQTVNVEKKLVCIIHNPFYNVMNSPNSTVKRLVSKMNILDVIDNQSGSGKLDIIIQLPYAIRSDKRKEQAEERRANIESQMSGSKYGVAYVDATEKITQLNRPAENNLMNQIEYLTRMLYGQLGMTEGILDGTASEEVMLNYYNRVIDVFLTSICLEIERKWISDNSFTRGHRIRVMKDPLRYVPASKIGEMLEGLSRNEIYSSDESREMFGKLPRNTDRSGALLNKQISENAVSDVGTEEEENSEQEV